MRWVLSALDGDLVKYPFLRRAREVLAQRSPDDTGLPRAEIMDQARYRVERALRNADAEMQALKDVPAYVDFYGRTHRYDAQNEIVEFYSFFVAVQAAAKDPFITTCLAKSEAQRAKGFFLKESTDDMLRIFQEATDLELKPRPEGLFDCPVEGYLQFGSEHDLFEDHDWRLARLPLERGTIHFSLNLVKDLFASLVNSLMVTGMKAGRGQPTRADVLQLVRQMEPLVPRRDSGSRANYSYVDEVLKHHVSDGRHRLTWLVLAPYLVNVKGMDEQAAVDVIMQYLGDQKYRQFVRYQVRRSVRQGLLPPSLSTLKNRHRDLYAIVSSQALTA